MSATELFLKRTGQASWSMMVSTEARMESRERMITKTITSPESANVTTDYICIYGCVLIRVIILVFGSNLNM